MTSKTWRGVLWAVLIIVVAMAGLSLRVVRDRLPFRGPAAPAATFYFMSGNYLYPVSRSLDGSADVPRISMEALLQGPKAGTGLTSPIPPGTHLLSLDVSGETARVDLSAEFLKSEDGNRARVVIVDTLTAYPAITSVILSVEGKPLDNTPLTRIPLLYFASDMGLIGVPAMAADARTAVDAYLAGPPEKTWNGLPGDVRVLQFGTSGGIVSLRFPYTESLRSLALSRPDRMRMALVGFIATLTEYRDVKAVRIDFEGESQSNLSGYGDLLLSPQSRPRLFNDERVLGL